MSPATFASQRFYKKQDDEEWHAYREDSSTALCGESQISYNIDQISDVVPSGEKLHRKCAEALGLEPAPPQVEPISKPKAKAKAKSSK